MFFLSTQIIGSSSRANMCVLFRDIFNRKNPDAVNFSTVSLF